MADENFVKHPAKVKVVADINNVPLGEAEIGETFYDNATGYFYIRVVSGWKYCAMT